MSEYKRVIDYINSKYSVQDLLYKLYNIRVSAGYTFLCPFHDDSAKSAKLFDDNHFYCFAESRQYSAYDILKANGVSFSQLKNKVPDDYVVEDKGARNSEILLAYARGFREQFKESGDLEELIMLWHKALTRMGF